MSERGGYAPEALQKKPEDESKDWKEHAELLQIRGNRHDSLRR